MIPILENQIEQKKECAKSNARWLDAAGVLLRGFGECI